MTTRSEHKTVQARSVADAQEIGWTYVPPKRFKTATLSSECRIAGNRGREVGGVNRFVRAWLQFKSKMLRASMVSIP
jgi:hypothetical protein